MADGIAVLIQRMVPAEYAGVAFTADPLTGERDVVRIGAGAGLGDALVSGESVGTDVTVRRVAAEDIVMGDAKGIEEGLLSEVADLAREVESYQGVPQDVEWAYTAGVLHLLQARPITVLPVWPVLPDGKGWAKDFAHYPEPVTPFGFSAEQATAPGMASMFVELGLMGSRIWRPGWWVGKSTREPSRHSVPPVMRLLRRRGSWTFSLVCYNRCGPSTGALARHWRATSTAGGSRSTSNSMRLGRSAPPPDISKMPAALVAMNAPVLWAMGHESPEPSVPTDGDVAELVGVAAAPGLAEGTVKVAPATPSVCHRRVPANRHAASAERTGLAVVLLSVDVGCARRDRRRSRHRALDSRPDRDRHVLDGARSDDAKRGARLRDPQKESPDGEVPTDGWTFADITLLWAALAVPSLAVGIPKRPMHATRSSRPVADDAALTASVPPGMP